MNLSSLLAISGYVTVTYDRECFIEENNCEKRHADLKLKGAIVFGMTRKHQQFKQRSAILTTSVSVSRHSKISGQLHVYQVLGDCLGKNYLLITSRP